MIEDKNLDYLITLALKEDIGEGDITTDAIFSGTEHAVGEFIAKENGIIAGIELTRKIFSLLDEELVFSTNVNDGERVHRGQLLATVEGAANVILTGERTVLNFMQRMSGIASLTHLFVQEVSHTKAKILDTRKTAPGHRFSDKWAVRLGGGVNHRFRLDDRFLIKENHGAVAGDLVSAVKRCMEYKLNHKLSAPIEVEVTSVEECSTLLKKCPESIDYIMLDNMTTHDMIECVKLAKGKVPLEASGNVSLDTVKSISETGVDYISVGSLTHTVRALDISLLFVM